LTLAEQGACYLSTTSEVVVVPALPVNAVDSTGAGDTFIAGVIAGLVNQRSMHDCVRLGCYLASFAVTGSGSYERIPKQQLNFDQILTTH
jgi:sugar/nucleoside kinase (ribokinase family)